MIGYLRGAATATEVVTGWCAAFSPGTAAPAGCGTIPRPDLSDAFPKIGATLAQESLAFNRVTLGDMRHSLIAAAVTLALAIVPAARPIGAQGRVGSDSAKRTTRFARDFVYGSVEGLAFAGVTSCAPIRPSGERAGAVMESARRPTSANSPSRKR